MKNYKPFIIVLLLAAAGTAAYFWLTTSDRTTAISSPIPAGHCAIIYDRSESMRADPHCLAITSLAKRCFKEPHRRGDRLIVAATGDLASAMEPINLATVDIPITHRVMEGRTAQAAARKELLNDVGARCEKLPRMNNSAVFLAVKRALEQLRAAGCSIDGTCHLYVRTDGQESEESWFQNSLTRGRPLDKGRPAALDNRGIKVTFCGFSETKGEVTAKTSRKRYTAKRDAARADLLTTLWRQVFVSADDVVFEPLCPNPMLDSESLTQDGR